MPRRVTLGVLILSLATSMVWAQDCSKATTQREMDECAKQESDQADAMEKGIYNKLLAKVDDDVKRLLELAPPGSGVAAGYGQDLGDC